MEIILLSTLRSVDKMSAKLSINRLSVFSWFVVLFIFEPYGILWYNHSALVGYVMCGSSFFSIYISVL